MLTAALRAVGIAALAAWLLGCGGSAALVSEKAYAPPGAALERLAVIPFYAHRTYEGTKLLGGVPEAEATEQVTRLVHAALAERGIDVLPLADVARATQDLPRLTTAVDALVFAEAAARELGATGVLLGEVLRYRNGTGASAETRQPGSVAYQLTLFEAPEGFKVWSARFDETQPDPTPIPDTDGSVPPGYWMSAEQLAERGAASVARSLAGSR